MAKRFKILSESTLIDFFYKFLIFLLHECTFHQLARTGNATAIAWNKRISSNAKASHHGVYCLRTNQTDWSEASLWHTYTNLTNLEAVFRSFKSELGLRPIYHHKNRPCQRPYIHHLARLSSGANPAKATQTKKHPRQVEN